MMPEHLHFEDRSIGDTNLAHHHGHYGGGDEMNEALQAGLRQLNNSYLMVLKEDS